MSKKIDSLVPGFYTMPESQLKAALFPGLEKEGTKAATMYAEQAAMTPAARMNQTSQFLADMRAGRTPDVKMENNIPGSTAPLWSILAAEWIDTTEPVLGALDQISTTVRPEVTPAEPGTMATIGVRVNTEFGQTVESPTEFGTSTGLVGTTVAVNCTHRMTQGILYESDLRNGERVESFVQGLIRSHAEALLTAAFAEVASAASTTATEAGAVTAPASGKVGRIYVQNGTVTGAAAVTPEYVARTLSPIFRDGGDLLLLSPAGLAGLIPTNALSLGYAENTYGIRHIKKVAPFPTADSDSWSAFGCLMRRNALVMAAGTPYMARAEQGRIAWEPLGRINGVPLWLSTWFDAKHRGYVFAIESLVGFKLANPAGCYVLSEPAPVTETEPETETEEES